MRCHQWPHASSVCDDVLRGVEPGGPALSAVVTESLAYSTLQAGPEFARWLQERGPALYGPHHRTGAAAAYCDGDMLRIAFNRPQRHNAFSTDARAALAGGADRRAAVSVGDRDRVERQRTVVL